MNKPRLDALTFYIDSTGVRWRVQECAFGPFRLVSAHSERGSILLTSNKHVRDWPAVSADDEILATTILDRLLHHVQVLHIDGRSYRLRELGALLGPPTDAPTHPTQLPGVPQQPNSSTTRVREFVCSESAGIWVYLHRRVRAAVC